MATPGQEAASNADLPYAWVMARREFVTLMGGTVATR